jgi:hypothetical protein
MEPILAEPIIHEALPRGCGVKSVGFVLLASFVLTVFISVGLLEPLAPNDLEKTTLGTFVKPSQVLGHAALTRPLSKHGLAQASRPIERLHVHSQTLRGHPALRLHAENPLVKQVLTSTVQNVHTDQWTYTGPSYSVTKKTLHGGKQEGVDVITVDNGLISFDVIPTRGMSVGEVVVKDSKGDYPLGWTSPVKETVHPKHIKFDEFGGLGMLQGFNEQIFRGGVAFIGHPAKDGDFSLPLHGRFHNIPASEVEVIVDSEAPHRIRVRGRVDECMFKFCDFEMWT